MDLQQVTDSILESFKGIIEEDFEVGFEYSDTVNEINLKSKTDDKVFHVLVLESLKDFEGGES